MTRTVADLSISVGEREILMLIEDFLRRDVDMRD